MGLQASLQKDLKSLFKSLDFAAVGGAVVADSDSESIAMDAGEDEEDDSEDDEEEFESDSDDEVIATSVVAAAAPKGETKHEREERRKAEREEIKAKERAEKEARREDKPQVVLPKLKSPWVSNTSTRCPLTTTRR